MRILILHRPTEASGGDMVALNGYVAAMLRAGVDIVQRSATEPGDVSEFDYVHLWAACSPDWGLPAAQYVKEHGKPLVITPFWWSRAERLAFYHHDGDVAPGYTEAVGQTLRLADVLFTVTMSEVVECWKLAPRIPVHVVPMGFDIPPVEAKDWNGEQYILCIGRIEPHKNQYMLAAACDGLNVRLVLIGEERDWYAARIREDFPKVKFFPNATEIEKWEWLANARVHALPSFFENPGLVHGEALSVGVPAVMGGHGCEPEFYGENGIYCDPTNINDIMRAISQAWDAPRIKWQLPTWDDAAKKAVAWLNEH